MYKRLIILSVIILSALCGLTLLGYHAIEKWAQGMEGARLGEFAEVAEQIRQDVKRKLDDFIQAEQNRPYTDYQYYYVPENLALQQQQRQQQQMPLLRSPLGGRLENSFAYGNFQIEPDGSIITPNDDIIQREGATDFNRKLYLESQENRLNIKQNLLPVLGVASGTFKLPARDSLVSYETKTRYRDLTAADADKHEVIKKVQAKGKGGRAREYRIQSLQKESQAEQILTQRRSLVASNVEQIAKPSEQQIASVRRSGESERGRAEQADESVQAAEKDLADDRLQISQIQTEAEPLQRGAEQTEEPAALYDAQQPVMEESQSDTVQIRIEPFVPLVVGGRDVQKSILGGQVFLLRHVQIEARHFLQGFQLNEKKLLDEVKESASLFMREGMGFELPQIEDEDAAGTAAEDADIAYTAILDFGFGDLILNLKELDPAWIGKQISQLRNWYFSIIVVVLLAVTLGLASLWRSARAQVKLAQKKDDFISAVSHELRTPLTSIRMYAEMLEKNWVKSEDKLGEYYESMRQESERLSRLIENVLDFSRIQKGRKKYAFTLGDINQCVAGVVEMMRPYAEQRGFSINTELEQLKQTSFDRDAVTQIVVNLLDNAIKYARDAKDKTITVRTKSDSQFILLEVEDHGPGVPHRQRKKVFEEFYRTGSEATRETTGTGLGLALVKKFAQAHNGFVEILTAKPAGAIFRVGLTAQS